MHCKYRFEIRNTFGNISKHFWNQFLCLSLSLCRWLKLNWIIFWLKFLIIILSLPSYLLLSFFLFSFSQFENDRIPLNVINHLNILHFFLSFIILWVYCLNVSVVLCVCLSACLLAIIFLSLTTLTICFVLCLNSI
jgi:hypothetical protein